MTLDLGKSVLKTEAQALIALADSLGEAFERAVDILYQTKGRVIISGMGKSGHIGSKIAATLSSTGTPAQFVHPGEASHGDLGMITKYDSVLALSNSGKTSELQDLITYTRRFAIPLISITSKANSPLALASDVNLLLPNTPEACPMGLAPTTSTTATLALGDSLAVVLLEKRGFQENDFKVFHPGGSLGQQLLILKEIMHKGAKLPLVSSQTPMKEALITLSEKGFGCIGVISEDRKLQGVITDGDLRRSMGPNLLDLSAESVMTPSPVSIGSSHLLAEAVHLMNKHKITALFITNDDREVEGLIHLHDALRLGAA